MIVASGELGANAKLVAFVLSTHMDVNGTSCFPSLTTLQHETSLSRRAVCHALDRVTTTCPWGVALTRGARRRELPATRLETAWRELLRLRVRRRSCREDSEPPTWLIGRPITSAIARETPRARTTCWNGPSTEEDANLDLHPPRCSSGSSPRLLIAPVAHYAPNGTVKLDLLPSGSVAEKRIR